MVIVGIRGDHPGSNGRLKGALLSLGLCRVLRYHQKPENAGCYTGAFVVEKKIHLPVLSFLMKTAPGVAEVALVRIQRAIFDLLKIVAATGAPAQPVGHFCHKQLWSFGVFHLPQLHSSPPSARCKQGTWRDTARGSSWCKICSCLIISNRSLTHTCKHTNFKWESWEVTPNKTSQISFLTQTNQSRLEL